jgi:hypothetical protein
MITFLNLISFFILTGWFLFVATQIAKGKKDSILFVICIFYVFFGIPLILDVVRGMPSYTGRPGFFLASRDTLTSIIYSIYVAVVPLFWWLTRTKSKISNMPNKNTMKFDTNDFVKKYRSILLPTLFILLFSPVILWCFAPEPQLYLIYGNTSARGFSEASTEYHVYITLSIFISVLASCLLFMIKRSNLLLFFITCLFPFLFISVWLNGKRFIVFLVIALFSYLLLNKGILRGKKLLVYSIFIVTVLGVYTNVYQTIYRADSYTNQEVRYENFRLDFGRDDVTKMAIYAELDPDLKVLEQRGQSVLFNTLFFIPRDVWENKPYPYPKYMTSAMFLQEFQLWSWGVTTSIIDSAIADFSWLGLLLGPLFITMICHIGAKKNRVVINYLTTLVACLFLVLHLPAFVPIFLLWIFMVFGPKRRTRTI